MQLTRPHAPHRSNGRRLSIIGFVVGLFALDLVLMVLMGRSIYILAPIVSFHVYLLEAAFIVSSVSALLALRGLWRSWSEQRTAACILLAALWFPVAPLLQVVLPERFSYAECLSVQKYVFPLTPCGGDSGSGHHHLDHPGLRR